VTVVPRTPEPLAPALPRARRTGHTGDSRHGPVAQLLIAWSPLSVLLLVYAVAGWISGPLDPGGSGAEANRLGFGLHTTGPASLDRWLFGGSLPSTWLQQRLYDGDAHWYDGVAALVYATHFVTIPLLTGLVWFAVRPRFRTWLVTLLAFTVIGIGGYVVYPAAPPWMVHTSGPGAVQRISDLGWQQLHLPPLGDLMGSAQGISNPVAAMPSLHAGTALLITLFLWPLVGRTLRAVLVVYVALMGLTLVYTGEHYVVDVLAGWAVAVAAVLLGQLVGGWLERAIAARSAAVPA
jgi:membrane-associated phospholipid phosphatase